MVKYCPNCKPHPFQDGRYGLNMRVHTPTPGKRGGGDGGHCTVCTPHKVKVSPTGKNK